LQMQVEFANYADVRIMPMFSWTWCLT
jgi:hypothetical protein